MSNTFKFKRYIGNSSSDTFSIDKGDKYIGCSFYFMHIDDDELPDDTFKDCYFENVTFTSGAHLNGLDNGNCIAYKDKLLLKKSSRYEMEVTTDMVHAAIKQAVRDGILPRYAPMETYEHHWESMERIIKAAIAKGEL